jgi:hypothetical protein
MARKLVRQKIGNAVDAKKCFVQTVEMQDEMRTAVYPG